MKVLTKLLNLLHATHPRLAWERAKRARDRKDEAPEAFSPDPAWAKRSPTSLAFFVLVALLLLACLLPGVPQRPLSLAFTVVGGAGLAFRFYYYAQRRLLLYFLDLCYWAVSHKVPDWDGTGEPCHCCAWC